ncbi:MAG: LysR family transcriptional regulator [Betaproteobacteria bacterium]|nr:LysR family transcriptional regulator [Betaproteobacteria bacterium]
MRLRHIEVFHAVMQAGTVSGAALLLHISQPAVTKVLQHCEARLKISLFERVRGKLYPTPEAHRLFVEVDRMNKDLAAIRRMAASFRRDETESLRVMATPTLGLSVIPEAMQHWVKAFPKGNCVLSTNHTREIVNALLLGETDLALSLWDPRHPNIKVESLATGQMMALCHRDSVEGQKSGPLHISALTGDLVGLPEDDPLGNRVLSACDEHGVQVLTRITVQTYGLARSLAEAAVAMAVVDPFTAAGADPSRVIARPLTPAIPVQLFLLTPNVAPLSQPARRMVKFLGESAVALLES